MQVTKEKIVSDLKTIGVKEGDILAIGLSLKSVGEVRGGAQTVIEALVDAVGPTGTVMMNTYTHYEPLKKARSGKSGLLFDAKKSKTYTGVVPELFRQSIHVLRSLHPVTSVAAIGPKAHYLVDGHDHAAPAYLPYSRLAAIQGKMLCVGIGDNIVGLRHEAQNLAGLLSVIPFNCGVRYVDCDGNISVFKFRDKAGCVKKLPDLVPSLRQLGIVHDGNIGNAKSIFMPVREALEYMSETLKAAPCKNLCDGPFCIWCRELERRMDLYSDLSKQEPFQKYFALKEALHLLNWFRLRNSRTANALVQSIIRVRKRFA